MRMPEDLLAYCEHDPVFDSLRSRAEYLHNALSASKFSFQFEAHVFPWRVFLTPDVVECMVNDLQKSAKHWKGYSIQALQIVYPGFTEDEETFDPTGTISGFSNCDDTLQATNRQFSSQGRVDLQNYFAEIESMLENFAEFSDAINEYMQCLAFVYVHISMSIFAQSEEFKEYEIAYPLYVFGNVEGGEPVLILKRAAV